MISLIIAAASLGVSILSAAYTRHFNRFSVLVTGAEIEHPSLTPALLSVHIFNDSPKAIIIKCLNCYDLHGIPIPWVREYEYETDLYECDVQQEPFRHPFVLPSQSSRTLTYFVSEDQEDIRIDVTANHAIQAFHRTKSVFVHVEQTD